jgi:hypothetical protein
MIFATANAHHCIPARNLSTTYKHYTTNTDLCSTAKSTLETYCNLSTAIDLWKVPGEPTEPVAVLARPLYIPFDHTATVGLSYSLTRHIAICPPTNTKPYRPDINLWPTNTEPRLRDPVLILARPLRTLTIILWAVYQEVIQKHSSIFCRFTIKY